MLAQTLSEVHTREAESRRSHLGKSDPMILKLVKLILDLFHRTLRILKLQMWYYGQIWTSNFYIKWELSENYNQMAVNYGFVIMVKFRQQILRKMGIFGKLQPKLQDNIFIE